MLKHLEFGIFSCDIENSFLFFVQEQKGLLPMHCTFAVLSCYIIKYYSIILSHTVYYQVSLYNIMINLTVVLRILIAYI
jgi:hypothetical protein